MATNRRIELHLFNRFVELAGLGTFNNLEQPKPPEPDIVFQFKGRTIGTEIVRYYKTDNTLKRQEGEQDALVEMAQQQYESFGLSAVNVSIHWAIGRQFAKRDRRQLARALVDVVRANTPPLGGAIECDWAALTGPLFSMVHHLRIDRSINYKHNSWHAARSGWIVDAEAQEIQSIIQGKNRKYRNYHGRCDELWLLIAVESWSPSSWCEVTQSVQDASYQTQFSKLYLLADSPQRVVELRTRQECKSSTCS